MSISRPTTLGGTIAVEDSDELATLNPIGLPLGTRVFNLDVGNFFKLTASERTEITIDPTDGYDSPTWTFANATFTGFEGCTLLIGLTGLNAALSRAYVIDTVGSATEVDVEDPPDGTSTGALTGSVFLYDDALSADEVVAVSGLNGVRWVIDIGAPATATTPGIMSAADFVKLQDIDYGEWYSGVVTTMRAAAPLLTAFSPEIKIGTEVLGTPIADPGGVDALLPGGAIKTENAKNTALVPYSIFQTPKTTSWAVAFRAKITTAVGFNFIGLQNAAGNHDYGVAFESGVNATKYLLYTYNGVEFTVATTLSNDGAWHTFVVAFDGTTLKLYIDGVSQATTTTLTRITDENVYAAMTATPGAGAVTVSRFAYGYISP